jgi:hypothetical protein
LQEVSHFESLLSVEKVKVRPKAIWDLNRELVYHSDLVGTIIVPKHFRTDFASVPRMPLGYWAVGGKADEPAAVHDLLYTTQRFDRELCDKIFEEAIISQGYNARTASIMYAGVRLGGWYTWDLPNVPQWESVAKKLDISDVMLP